MSESSKLDKEFRRLRFSADRQLGLGDVRITQGQQEEILTSMRMLEDRIWLAESSLQEIQSLLENVSAALPKIDQALEKLKL